MLVLQVLGIAVALSIDAMVVALCWSATCKHVTTKHIFQFAAAFGFFQFLMPLAGGLAGNTVADLVSSWDHWIAFALLAWVSLSMVREAFGDEVADTDESGCGQLRQVELRAGFGAPASAEDHCRTAGKKVRFHADADGMDVGFMAVGTDQAGGA